MASEPAEQQPLRGHGPARRGLAGLVLTTLVGADSRARAAGLAVAVAELERGGTFAAVRVRRAPRVPDVPVERGGLRIAGRRPSTACGRARGDFTPDVTRSVGSPGLIDGEGA